MKETMNMDAIESALFAPDPFDWQELGLSQSDFFYTGSSLCASVDEPNDIDVVVQYTCKRVDRAVAAGYTLTARESSAEAYENDSVACTARKGIYNIIFVADADDYRNWLKASRLLGILDLKEKRQRAALFQFITEGKVRGTDLVY